MTAPKKVPGKPEPEKKKQKKSPLKNKKVLILLVCVLAVAGAAYKMFMPTPPPGPAKGGDIVTMDPTTLNLADGHYLKVGIAIQLVEGKGTKDSFVTSPATDLVIDQFSNRTVAALSSNAAREKLMGQLVTRLKKAYPGEVYKVYKTTFVTQ
jgi:flagellar FliL protein